MVLFMAIYETLHCSQALTADSVRTLSTYVPQRLMRDAIAAVGLLRNGVRD